MQPSETKKIFILRNNDLGDVLLTTPLVRGLKNNFPEAKVFIGVGDWAKPLVENNPDLDGIIKMNAPWHNKQNCRFPANSPRTFLEGLIYVLISREARFLREQKYTHGIDVLGSRQGSWLLRRSRIPHRFGVRGYAGGDESCEKCVDFVENCKVAESALAFLPLLGGQEKVDSRPILSLDTKELDEADQIWGTPAKSSKRIIIAPGAGFPEKSWGNERFTKLVDILYNRTNHQIRIIGSKDDRKRIDCDVSGQKGLRLLNYCGKLSLRQSAALVCRSDFVISNSSITMHWAGSYEIPSITILGECYESAKLHQEQWGHPDGIVLGKESSENVLDLPQPDEIYAKMNLLLSNE
jgi:ADP-heptose:LPS heptosyltransferase